MRSGIAYPIIANPPRHRLYLCSRCFGLACAQYINSPSAAHLLDSSLQEPNGFLNHIKPILPIFCPLLARLHLPAVMDFQIISRFTDGEDFQWAEFGTACLLAVLLSALTFLSYTPRVHQKSPPFTANKLPFIGSLGFTTEQW